MIGVTSVIVVSALALATIILYGVCHFLNAFDRRKTWSVITGSLGTAFLIFLFMGILWMTVMTFPKMF